MSNRRTIGGVILDKSKPTVELSSPLRRRSLAIVSTPNVPKDIIQNDDESEILARRRHSGPLEQSESTENTERRVSLVSVAGLSANEIVEHYDKCLKLCAENKINSKNVFALSMIDYMAVLNKRDQNSNNMQAAGTALDVGTKIYGLRVDCVHSDAFKMAGNLGTQEKEKDVDPEAQDAANLSNAEGPELKRKKKRKTQQILVPENDEPAEIEVLNLRPKSDNSDTQTTDSLLQITFPTHRINGHNLHLWEDVLYDLPDDKENDADSIRSEVEVEDVEPLEDLEICSTLANFSIIGWSEANIPNPDASILSMPANGGVEAEIRFDLDASLVTPCDNDTGMNYFDLDDATQENIDRCGRRGGEEIENIVDFREFIVEKNKKENAEYSYLQKSANQFHWAGPSHWKPRVVPNFVNGSEVVGACRQKSARKKKELNLKQSAESTEDFFYKLKSKIPTKLQAKTLRRAWQEEKLTLPEDVHYDCNNPIKFYLQSSRIKPLVQEAEHNTEANTLLDEVCENYNYDNLNDTQDYCSLNNAEAEEIDGDDNVIGFSNGDHRDDDNDQELNGNPCADAWTQGFTGENLVALPKSTTQIQIPYSVKAKKIDMRQLKQSIWKALISEDEIDGREGGGDRARNNNETEFAQPKEGQDFTKIYKKLPVFLGKDNVEALSPALAFASLLHLANEKNLSLISDADSSDLKIVQGQFKELE